MGGERPTIKSGNYDQRNGFTGQFALQKLLLTNVHWQAGKLPQATELAPRFSYFSLQLVQFHSSSF